MRTLKKVDNICGVINIHLTLVNSCQQVDLQKTKFKKIIANILNMNVKIIVIIIIIIIIIIITELKKGK